MTKQLAQYSVPAENSRIIRVFLSSTFRDMEMERSALVKLFKALQVKAASRGVTISLVDLRWGITEEDAKSGKVVEICLKEIVNSRPFFIGMVGERYGWCPSYEDLSQTFSDGLKYNWMEDDLNNHLSVTEIEMQFGVLRNPHPLHAYFYIKQSADDGRSCSTEEALKLKRLKECILQQDRYPVQKYDSPEQLCDLVECAFTELLEREFPDILTVEDNQELQEQLMRNELLSNYHPVSEADQAFADFLADGEQRCLVLTGDCGIGKSALLAHWSDWVNNDIPMIPVYHRLDDTALSSYPETLARMLASKCQNAFKNQSLGGESLFATEVSKESDLVRRISESVLDIAKNAMMFGKEVLNTFSENTLRNIKEIEEDLKSIHNFGQLWNALSVSRYPVVLLIDDISYLNPTDISLFSLFASIPTNVKVVLSFSASSTAGLPFVQNGYAHFRLNGFSQAEARSFSEQYLSTYSKALSVRQEEILGSWVLANRPRCLSVLLNELVSFGRYEELNEYMSGYCRMNEIGQFYDSVLRRLSADYGFDEISRTLLMLSLTLEGFTEDELKSMTDINQLLWSQLRVEMSSWLTNKGGKYRIFDTQMVEAVGRCFASDDESVDNCRQEIVEALLDESDILSHSLTFADYNHRLKQFCYHDSYRYKVEITYQIYKMQQWDFLREWICEAEIFEILYRTNRSLLEDCWKAMMNDNPSFTPESYTTSDFASVDSFLVPVIANDMATFLSRSFHLTEAANVVSEKSLEGVAIPPIAQSVLKMNEGCRYAREEEYDMACDCFLKALEMQEKIVPAPVLEITNTCRNLGMAFYYNGHYDEAVTYLNRALTGHAASTDENNKAEIIELYELLAYCDYYKKNGEIAAEKFREVVEMHTSLNGRLSNGVAKCLRMQAKCLYMMKRYDEAWNLMNQSLDIVIQINNRKQLVACHRELYYLCREFERIMRECGDELHSVLFFDESLLHEMFFSDKPRLTELTIRYEALRCDIMQRYYMEKEYDNVIRIATSLDIHDDGDPDSSCLVYYYKALAYTKKKNYPMAKAAFFREFELRKKHQGWENEDTIVACQNLGVLHKYCYERKDALACFREAYGHEVKQNGEDSELARTLLQYISFVK